MSAGLDELERGKVPTFMEKTIKMLASIFRQRRLVGILVFLWLSFAAFVQHGVSLELPSWEFYAAGVPITKNLRFTATDPALRALDESTELCITSKHLGFDSNLIKIGKNVYRGPIITKLSGNIVNLKERNVVNNKERTLKRFTIVHVREYNKLDTIVLQNNEAFCMQYAIDYIKDSAHNEL